MFIGEALIGDGDELAHVDLLIGEKDGPVGNAFANGLSQLSVGHTPLLSVIRPNLITKPATIIIPKVTVGDLDDASKIFGPAQTAVGRAVADCVEEGIIPKDKVEEMLEEGKNVVLEIEVQGALQVMEKVPEALTFFLVPPSMEELERRIRGRKTEAESVMQERLAKAEREIKTKDSYKHVVVNNTVEQAANEIADIIRHNIN